MSEENIEPVAVESVAEQVPPPEVVPEVEPSPPIPPPDTEMPVVPASVEAPKPELSKRDKVIMACAEAVHEMLRILYEAVENAGPLEHWEKSDATLQDEAIQIVTEVFNKDNPEFENNKGESDLIVATVVAMGKALGCQSRSLGTVDLP